MKLFVVHLAMKSTVPYIITVNPWVSNSNQWVRLNYNIVLLSLYLVLFKLSDEPSGWCPWLFASDEVVWLEFFLILLATLVSCNWNDSGVRRFFIECLTVDKSEINKFFTANEKKNVMFCTLMVGRKNAVQHTTRNVAVPGRVNLLTTSGQDTVPLTATIAQLISGTWCTLHNDNTQY